MAWRIEYTPKANKQLSKLNRHDAARIIKLLEEVAALDDPHHRGHALVGEFSGYWRYRAGDWRVVTRIEDERIVIVVITIGHRSEVYR